MRQKLMNVVKRKGKKWKQSAARIAVLGRAF